jgi:hypothetical protein
MLDNLLACIGYDEPFQLMLEGSNLSEEELKKLCLILNKFIAEQEEEITTLQDLLTKNGIKPVVEIKEVSGE